MAKAMPTELFAAVRDNDHDRAERLLDEGADVNATNAGYRRTPLHYAAMMGDGAMAALLLARGADANAADEHLMTPLASTPCNRTKGRASVAEALLAHGARADLVSDEGWSALHYAAFEGADDVAKLILARGASPDIKDHHGVTPLHVAAGNHSGGGAAQAAYERTVRALLDAGADVETRTTAAFGSWDMDHPPGVTPLEVAQAHGHEGIAALLAR